MSQCDNEYNVTMSSILDLAIKMRTEKQLIVLA